MIEALQHRAWRPWEIVGSSHALLARAPGADQEQFSATIECEVVFDGRLDNAADLRSHLQLPASCPDHWVVAHAYRRWSEGFAHRLEGEFAIAVWDQRLRRLLLVRDPLGARPICWWASKDGAAFASEAYAVAMASGVIELSTQRLLDCLILDLEPGEGTETFFSHVHRLRPGHFLTLEEGARKEQKFGDDLWGVSEPPLETDLGRLADTLDDAVRRHAQGSRHAILLSGGLDSAMVASSAARQGLPATSFSAIRPDFAGEESRRILLLSEHLPLDGQQISSAKSVTNWSSALSGVKAEDDPFDILMALPAALYQNIAARGLSVALDGVDGDIALGMAPQAPAGFPAILWRRFWWPRIWSLRRDWDSWHPVAEASFRRASQWALPNSLQGPIRRFSLKRLFARRMAASFLLPEVVRENGLEDRWRSCLSAPDRLGKVVAAAFERYNRVAARYGVLASHPLLDRVVIRQSRKFNPCFIEPSFGSKALLRMLGLGQVPAEICFGKRLPGLGYDFLLRRIETERIFVKEALTSDFGVVSSLVDVARLRKAFENQEDLHAGIVWRICKLSAWSQTLSRSSSSRSDNRGRLP